MHRLISANFKLSVLVTPLGCVAILLGSAQGFSDSVAYLGAPGNYTIIGPAVISLLTPFLWFASYRHGEGHIPAFFVGFSLLIPAVASTIADSLIGPLFNKGEQFFLFYTGISHIAYALLNWQDLIMALGRDAD